jgi:uncharacterized lipoprotein YddW (UPF0748 family)
MIALNVLFFVAASLVAQSSSAPEVRVRGIRVDPGYFYTMYPDQAPKQVAKEVVKAAKASKINTLFLYTYNHVYGALYPTDYPLTTVENGLGTANIVQEIIKAANAGGMKVVAVVPVNNFREVWVHKPEWRSKKSNGSDYVPAHNTFMLSAHHPEFQTWLKGFYDDLLTRNPGLDGIEAVEPFVDLNWAKESDYNPKAMEAFKLAYPSAKPGDKDWFHHRAQGLTELIAILNTAAHRHKKSSFLVQTWPAKANGKLVSSTVIKNNLGLDFDAILALKDEEKLDYVIAELMWQQWAAEYGRKQFPVTWTKQAARDFIKYVDGRSMPLIHLEISLFTGKSGTVIPTPEEFGESLSLLRDMDVGVEVYDHNQISKQNAWNHLLSWH